MKTELTVDKWDLVIYDIGDGVDEGAVLDVYEGEEIRTDTDGVISQNSILYVVKEAGKQNIYDSSGYKDAEYRKSLYRNYGLEIIKLPEGAKDPPLPQVSAQNKDSITPDLSCESYRYCQIRHVKKNMDNIYRCKIMKYKECYDPSIEDFSVMTHSPLWCPDKRKKEIS